MTTGYFVAKARRTRQEIRGGHKMRYAPWVDWDFHTTGTGWRRFSRRQEWEWVEGEEGLSQVWKPGDHVSIFARTDWGKTHLVLKGLANLWDEEYPWLCVDCKGDDPMLQGFGHRVGKLPPRIIRERFHDSQRYRIVVPYSVDQIPKAAATVREALRTARRETGWILHFNEARALTDPKAPGLGLSGQLQAYWRMGRPHVTIIAETQAPRWVPTDMYDQSSHVYIGGNLDERARRRLGEIGGDTDNIWRTVSLLGEHEFLYVRSLDGLMQIVKAPA
jgi:hypothetical protein